MLKAACLGAGYFAQFQHDAWRRLDGVELAAVANRDITKAQAASDAAFSNLEDMLEAIRPDIVDIITPPPTHKEAIKTALRYAPKVIICQKPFCESLEEALEMTALAKEAGVPLVIHENFRFQPWYRAIKLAIDAGKIGELHQATVRMRTGDGQGPRAYLDRQPYFQTMPKLLIHETGVHWIDTFRFLMGEPSAVYADLRRMNPVIAGEDAGHVLFDFEGGKRALLDGNRLLDHAAENHRTTLCEALIEGTEGTLTLHGDGSVHLRKFGEIATETVLAAENWPGFAGDCVGALQAHVVSHLLHGTPLENTAEEYCPVVEIEDAVYRSDAEQRKLPL